MTTVTRSRSRSASSVPEVRLSSKQRAFCTSSARFPLFRGAIRCGKTYAGAVRSIDRRYRYPGTTQIIGGPSWSQLRDGTIRTLLRLINPACIAKHNETTGQIVLDNGSEFLCRTLDSPDVLRAIEAHDAWIDEIAMTPADALDIGIARISLPYTTDPSFKNSLWGTTTPRGMDWTLDVWGQDGHGEYEVTHCTIYDNREHLPDGLIESLEAKYEGTPFFEQELLGLYTAFEGLVYPMFSRGTHVRRAAKIIDCRSYGVGIDWGGTAAPTAGVFIGETAIGHAHQYAEFYRVGATLSDVAGWLDECRTKARLERRQLRVWCDTAEQTSINELAALGFAARGANKDRLTGIRHVAAELSAESLTIDEACVSTIAEFGQYIWARKKDGETKVVYTSNQPIDHHADALDGLRYVRMGMTSSGETVDRRNIGRPASRYGGIVRA